MTPFSRITTLATTNQKATIIFSPQTIHQENKKLKEMSNRKATAGVELSAKKPVYERED